jgi:hypothetical protein
MTNLSKKDKQGVALIVAVFVGLAILVFYNISLSSRAKPDARSCIAPIAKRTVFVVDQSDSIASQTSSEILRRIRKVVSADVSSNELVTIFQITDGSRTHLEPIFSKCKPEQGGNELTDNVRLIQKRFVEEFDKPLETALAASPPKSENSPIGEVLIDVSLSDYLRGETNRLVIFSDLMQNSGNASLYRCGDSRQAIAEFRNRRAGAVERPTFKNTNIALNFIPREGIGHEALRCRTGFWAWFFGDNEGSNASLTPDYLPGGAKM